MVRPCALLHRLTSPSQQIQPESRFINTTVGYLQDTSRLEYNSMWLLSSVKCLILHLVVATGVDPMYRLAMLVACGAFGTISVAIELSCASILPIGRWKGNSTGR